MLPAWLQGPRVDDTPSGGHPVEVWKQALEDPDVADARKVELRRKLEGG